MPQILLMLVALIGLYISTYFTLVYYRKIRPDTTFIPGFCRMEDNTCQLVIHHKAARVFYLPNFVLGMIYYAAVILFAFGVSFPFFGTMLLYASWLTVLLAIYLIYSLVYVVKIICPLCLVSHTMNILIALILTFWW
ncbi:MAG: vitamin K epoxide reductase family protein [Bacteroidota bacterium]